MFAKQTSRSASLIVVLAWPVIALADPEPTGTFEIGAGYDTDYGFGAVARVSQSDLFHTGNALTLSSEISERRQRFDLTFVDPQLGLGGDLFRDTRMLRPGLWRDSTGIAVTEKVQLSRHWRASVGYRLEDVTASSDFSARSLQPVAMAPGLLSTVTARLEYSTLDTPIEPLRGSTFGAQLDYSDPRLGSSLELARGTAWAATNQPLGPLTLHAGLRATAISSDSPIPLSERLYLEGSHDVRGYGLGGIGPVDGGTYSLVGHVSLELPVYRGFSVEGFADGADISGYRGASTGFGVIWRSPIGPLHFDVAFPIGGGAPMLTFGIGSLW
jgi:outer membrane protein assembly factor BamA